VLCNPSRRYVAFAADSAVRVSVFDAAGRVIARRAAQAGLNILPLSKAGVYVIQAAACGRTTTQKLVVGR